jgi:hypothetical protein
MKKALALLALLLACSLLPAQKVTNVRVSQHPELRYYQITFDLSGGGKDLYWIQAVPYKTGREPGSLSFLSGQGINQPCSPARTCRSFGRWTWRGLRRKAGNSD